jgi:hypothetical protein
MGPVEVEGVRGLTMMSDADAKVNGTDRGDNSAAGREKTYI